MVGIVSCSLLVLFGNLQRCLALTKYASRYARGTHLDVLFVSVRPGFEKSPNNFGMNLLGS